MQHSPPITKTYFIKPVHAPHEKEGSFFIRDVQVISHVQPDCPQLGDTVVADRQPVGDDGSMELLVGIGLGKECHTEGPKVSPQEEIEGVQCVGAPACMLQVVLATKLTIWGQLYTTVIVEAIGVDLGVIL